MMAQFAESTTRHRWVKLKPDFFYSFAYFICKVGQSGSVSFGAFDRVLFLQLKHETISEVLAIGSTAFTWKLCCPALPGLEPCDIVVWNQNSRLQCSHAWLEICATEYTSVQNIHELFHETRNIVTFRGFLRLSTILSDIAWSAKTVCLDRIAPPDGQTCVWYWLGQVTTFRYLLYARPALIGFQVTSCLLVQLTHCGLVMPYGIMDLIVNVGFR